MRKSNQLTCRATRIAVLACAFMSIATVCRAQRLDARRPAFWGFAAPWDPQSDVSIRANARYLGAVITGWIGLDSATGQPLLQAFPDTLRLRGATRMAMVTSWHGQRFHATSIRALSGNPRALARAAGAIARHSRSMGYRGVVLDFETLERTDLDAQLRVMKAIADSARARGVRTVAAAIPAMDTAAYPARALLGVVDFVIPMLYDQHWSGSVPGPISAPAWVRSALALRIAEVGADRIVVGLPTYSYQWRRGQPTQDLAYVDARRIAVQARAPLRRDRETGTLYSRTRAWEMWVTDAELLDQLVRESRQAGVRRFALWRMGREDPAIWQRVVR